MIECYPRQRRWAAAQIAASTLLAALLFLPQLAMSQIVQPDLPYDQDALEPYISNEVTLK